MGHSLTVFDEVIEEVEGQILWRGNIYPRTQAATLLSYSKFKREAYKGQYVPCYNECLKEALKIHQRDLLTFKALCFKVHTKITQLRPHAEYPIERFDWGIRILHKDYYIDIIAQNKDEQFAPPLTFEGFVHWPTLRQNGYKVQYLKQPFLIHNFMRFLPKAKKIWWKMVPSVEEELNFLSWKKQNS